MSYQTQKERQLSQEYKSLLTEVIVQFLMSHSTDFVEFAHNFFQNRLRNSTPDDDEEEESEILSEIRSTSVETSTYFSRRGAVTGDSLNEEELLKSQSSYPVFPKTNEQKEKLHKILKKILLFKWVGLEEMAKLIDAMQLKKVSPGEFVINQGDIGDFFYVIEEGRFVAVLDDEVLTEYKDEGCFGELALMYNLPRACSVRAVTSGTLWAMGRHTFQTVLVSRALHRRVLYNSLIERVPMLQKLSPFEKANLADAFITAKYPSGSAIIKEGDPADRMYFVEKGTVVVKAWDKNLGGERILNRLKEGDYFGEMALITRKPRAASVYAEGEVSLACVTVEAFERLLGPCMEIMKRKILDYDSLL